MNKNFLDYIGLAKYTAKIKAFVDSKVAVLVPASRTVNGKALTSDISLNASDVGAKSSDWTPDLSGYVPTSRTVNGKALSYNITLSASDVSARPSTWTPNASDVGAVPTSRTVNGKTLSSDITLTASDVGALPITGGTLSGDLTLKGSGNFGTKINLGNGDYVHISEPTDNCMEIKANKVNFVLSDTTDDKFTLNGASPFAALQALITAAQQSADNAQDTASAAVQITNGSVTIPANGSKTISFPFYPKLLVGSAVFIWVVGGTGAFIRNNMTIYANTTLNGKTLKISNPYTGEIGFTYVAFGTNEDYDG